MTTKKQPKAPAKKKLPKIKCPNCGKTYTLGQPHRMFCPACTCDECGTTFGYPLPVYDSRVTPVLRKCDRCLEREMDSEEG